MFPMKKKVTSSDPCCSQGLAAPVTHHNFKMVSAIKGLFYTAKTSSFVYSDRSFMLLEDLLSPLGYSSFPDS